MSLNYDTSKCRKPENDAEKLVLDCLIWATMTTGMNEITHGNAGEFYARLHMAELIDGPFRTVVGGGKVYFTPEEVALGIGLTTNADALTRTKFLKRYDFFLNECERKYYEEVKK